MLGVKIVRRGKSVDVARVEDTILDTSLESLPIYWDGEFDLHVIPAAADFGTSLCRINHNLPYRPMAQAWIDYPLASGKVVRAKLPVFADDGWIYTLESKIDGVFIQADYVTPDASAIPNFNRQGYVYIYEKDLEQL